MIIQPIPTKSNGIAQNLTSIENYLYLVLALVSMFFITKQKINSPLLLSLLSITFLLYIFIGYTVCFSGAIVRYRSITLPFTMLPLIIFIFAREKETKLT